MNPHGNRKERGAYFTPAPIASLLVDWAIRSSDDRVLEPAAGRGALLAPAIERLRSLGADRPDVYAVELHQKSYERLRSAANIGGVPSISLRRGDFFAVAESLPLADAVITNPPYVRHHEVPVRAMARMRNSVRASGADLDGKASTWAYFVVRACEGLRVGGRLAAVLPFELLSTDYGRRLLAFVVRRFRKVSIVRCSDGVFDDLQLRVVLLLGDELLNDQGSADTVLIGAVEAEGTDVRLPTTLVECTLDAAPQWFANQAAGPSIEKMWNRCQSMPGVRRLSELAELRIGYVSGDASFFHLTENARRSSHITLPHVTKILARGSYADGIRFTAADWRELRDDDRRCWVLSPKDRQPVAVANLIANGTARGTHRGTKAAGRDPWWRVPLTETPAAFLVYMGGHIRLVANEASVHAPNSLYTVGRLNGISPSALVAASLTSVFQLSVLANRRDKGGGLTKLELSDAAKALVPVTTIAKADLHQLDRLVREGKRSEAMALADEVILRRGLGWSSGVIHEITAALLGDQSYSEHDPNIYFA